MFAARSWAPPSATSSSHLARRPHVGGAGGGSVGGHGGTAGAAGDVEDGAAATGTAADDKLNDGGAEVQSMAHLRRELVAEAVKLLTSQPRTALTLTLST